MCEGACQCRLAQAVVSLRKYTYIHLKLERVFYHITPSFNQANTSESSEHREVVLGEPTTVDAAPRRFKQLQLCAVSIVLNYT